MRKINTLLYFDPKYVLFAVYPMGVGTSSKSIFVYCCLYLVKVNYI